MTTVLIDVLLSSRQTRLRSSYLKFHELVETDWKPARFAVLTKTVLQSLLLLVSANHRYRSIVNTNTCTTSTSQFKIY